MLSSLDFELAGLETYPGRDYARCLIDHCRACCLIVHCRVARGENHENEYRKVGRRLQDWHRKGRGRMRAETHMIEVSSVLTGGTDLLGISILEN